MNSATLSPCGTYRYTLTRDIPQMIRWVKPCLFCLLNPSTADATVNDPTLNKGIRFATQWGCTSLTFVNLFALRSTDPKNLATHADPVGPANDQHIAEQLALHRMGYIVLAWGAHKLAPARARQIKHLFDGYALNALAVTKDGWPGHPLYLPYSAEPKSWEFPALEIK